MESYNKLFLSFISLLISICVVYVKYNDNTMIWYSESGLYNIDVTLVTPVVLCVRMLSAMRLIDYCVYYKMRLEIFLHSMIDQSKITGLEGKHSLAVSLDMKQCSFLSVSSSYLYNWAPNSFICTFHLARFSLVLNPMSMFIVPWICLHTIFIINHILLVCLLVLSCICCFLHWWINWFVDWLIDWLFYSLIDSPVPMTSNLHTCLLHLYWYGIVGWYIINDL